MNSSLNELDIKLFADGAEKEGILEMYQNSLIRGFTTNPTLMRKAGIVDYKAFALDILSFIKDRPISFEVFSDDLNEMKRQASLIATWGKNVYVKVPVTNTAGEFTGSVLRDLSRDGVKLNVTALMTLSQVKMVSEVLSPETPAIISIFAGRIADTGCDPVPLMSTAVDMIRSFPKQELLWASPRELLNVFQANAIGCHIITATNDILKKLNLVGKDLTEFSLDTVKMFYGDATEAGYNLS